MMILDQGLKNDKLNEENEKLKDTIESIKEFIDVCEVGRIENSESGSGRTAWTQTLVSESEEDEDDY